MPRKTTPQVVMQAPDANGAAAAESEGRRRLITYEWNGETRTLTQLREKRPVATFDWSQLNTDMVDRLAVHGLRQKLADSHAGKIPEAESLAAEVWENLVAGNWFGARGEGAERTSMFLEAYVRVMNSRGNPITVDQFRKIVNDIESGDDDEKKRNLRAIRDSEPITKAMNAIREERAAARRGNVDVALDAVL